MAAFKNIALWGVGGDNIGGHILTALINDGSYNLTIVARKSSKSTYPSSLNVVRVDDDLSHTSLVEALRGQDALVSAVGTAGITGQWDVAVAAAEAGVRRFIPSEYGFDNGDPKNSELSPIFKPKAELAEKLNGLSQKNPGFSWTGIATGIWLDWVLEIKFGDIDPENHSATYWDEGKQAPSWTTLPYAAQGVLAVLKRHEDFQNQRVFMEAFAASQKDIVAELEKQEGVKYTTSSVKGAEKVKEAHATLAQGFDMGAAFTTVKAEIWVADYKADFKASGKKPILEEYAELPKITLQEVVKSYIARQQK